MANLSQNLSFILLGEDRTASKTMTGAAATAEKVTARIGGAFQRVGGIIGGEFGNVISGVGTGLDELGQKAQHLSTLLTVGGGVALTAGIGLQQFGSGATQATDQLNAAITATGAASTDYTERIEKAVKKNENLDHSAVDTKQALQVLTQATGDTGKALNLMGIVTDLAAAKHISLSDAALLVNRVLGGSGARTLVQFGIHMDGVGTKTEQGKRALDELAKKLDGQAKASVSNFGSQVDIVKTKVKDFAEEVAGPVGGALTALGGVATATGLVLDIVKAKQTAAAAAALAHAAAEDVAATSTEALATETVALDGAMDANPIGVVAAAIGVLAAVAGGIALGSTHDLTKATNDYESALLGANGAIEKNIENTARKALLDDGSLAAAKQLGINGAVVVQAALGNAAAQRQLNDALAEQKRKLDAQYAAASQVADGGRAVEYTQKSARDAIDKLSGGVNDQSTALRNARTQADLYNGSLLTTIQRGNAASSGRYAGQAAAYANLPKHAGGGDIMNSQYSVVGENGPEVVRLPGGSHVFPNGQGPTGSGGGGLTVVLNGDVYGSPNAYAQAVVTKLITAAKQGHINGGELLSALAS